MRHEDQGFIECLLTPLHRESQGPKSNGDHAVADGYEDSFDGRWGKGSHSTNNNQRSKPIPLPDQHQSKGRWVGNKDGHILGQPYC